ncbi:MAG: cation:proton antiporter [Firmicutes bacterium]|nr:cation:proton antiporter [Bacillota bacterium]
MSELLFFAICFIVMALCLLIRVIIGPSVADRAVAADSIDLLADMALILFALYSGRSVFIDIAFITAILGFIGSTIVARYLEGKL